MEAAVTHVGELLVLDRVGGEDEQAAVGTGFEVAGLRLEVGWEAL